MPHQFRVSFTNFLQEFPVYVEMALHLFQDHRVILRGYSVDYKTIPPPGAK